MAPRKRKYTFRRYTVPDYIHAALETLRPPDDITVSQWAERSRILDDRSSHMPGPWRNDMTPYLTGIMDEFTNWETEKIVFCKPTQVGGTEALNNMLGYVVAQDAAPTLIVYPTDELAEFTSDNRIRPMIKACPELRHKFRAKGSTKLELQFDQMYISLTGSNSASGLASKPIRFLFFGEEVAPCTHGIVQAVLLHIDTGGQQLRPVRYGELRKIGLPVHDQLGAGFQLGVLPRLGKP